MLALLAAVAIDTPKIVTRQEWGAGPVILSPKRHAIRYVTIHHTGVAKKPETPLTTKLRNLQKWCQREDRTSFAHVKPAWPDIPYHYYVSWDGQVAEGRPAEFVGDTNTTYDPAGHLLIVVEGNFEKETPSEAQIKSLTAMTVWAAKRYNVPRVRIQGHGDYAKTDCPGASLKPVLSQLRTSF